MQKSNLWQESDVTWPFMFFHGLPTTLQMDTPTLFKGVFIEVYTIID